MSSAGRLGKGVSRKQGSRSNRTSGEPVKVPGELPDVSCASAATSPAGSAPLIPASPPFRASADYLTKTSPPGNPPIPAGAAATVSARPRPQAGSSRPNAAPMTATTRTGRAVLFAPGILSPHKDHRQGRGCGALHAIPQAPPLPLIFYGKIRQQSGGRWNIDSAYPRARRYTPATSRRRQRRPIQ